MDLTRSEICIPVLIGFLYGVALFHFRTRETFLAWPFAMEDGEGFAVRVGLQAISQRDLPLHWCMPKPQPEVPTELIYAERGDSRE